MHFVSLQVQNAVEYLKIIGALDENENLTVLGMGISYCKGPWVFKYGYNFFHEERPHDLYCHLSGRNLSMLPVEPKLGKMLILGAIFNCLDPIMTVVAGLSVRDPFLMPFDKKDVSLLSYSSLIFCKCEL